MDTLLSAPELLLSKLILKSSRWYVWKARLPRCVMSPVQNPRVEGYGFIRVNQQRSFSAQPGRILIVSLPYLWIKLATSLHARSLYDSKKNALRWLVERVQLSRTLSWNRERGRFTWNVFTSFLTNERFIMLGPVSRVVVLCKMGTVAIHNFPNSIWRQNRVEWP